jgi:hypothetical protein
MARVTSSAIVSQASGAVGGAVFGHGRYGLTVRTRVRPKNPRTANQQGTRAAFGSGNAAWHALPTASQQHWKEAAHQFPVTDALGKKSVLSGQAFFLGYQSRRKLVGLPAAPGLINPTGLFPSPPVDAFSDSGGADVFQDMDTTGTAQGYYECYTTVGLSPGISNASWDFYIAAVLAGQGGGGNIDYYPAAYNPKLVWESGQAVWVKVILLDTEAFPGPEYIFQTISS